MVNVRSLGFATVALIPFFIPQESQASTGKITAVEVSRTNKPNMVEATLYITGGPAYVRLGPAHKGQELVGFSLPFFQEPTCIGASRESKLCSYQQTFSLNEPGSEIFFGVSRNNGDSAEQFVSRDIVNALTDETPAGTRLTIAGMSCEVKEIGSVLCHCDTKIN